MTISVGLVGFGYAARVLHRPLILACGMHVAGVVSRHPEVVHAVLPTTPVFPDVESLLHLPGLDVVVIATPNDLHEQQAMTALGAGKVVLVEKPLTPSTGAADRLIQAADRGRGLLSVFITADGTVTSLPFGALLIPMHSVPSTPMRRAGTAIDLKCSIAGGNTQRTAAACSTIWAHTLSIRLCCCLATLNGYRPTCSISASTPSSMTRSNCAWESGSYELS